MSLGRIGSRAVVVGLGVLASLALIAAPSWAAKGGNSANSKLCEPGGYPGVLLNGHGEAFKNEGQCTKAGAHGELVGVNIVAGPVVAHEFTETCSGFGLKPSATAFCFVHWEDEFGSSAAGGGKSPVEANGTWTLAENEKHPCVGVFTIFELHLPVVGLFVEATTAEGVRFKQTFPPPSGCSSP
jgi:hypothetical protein